MGRIATVFGWLALTWWLWSGHLEPLLLGAGLASCAFVIWLSRRMEILDEEMEPMGVWLRLFGYLPWLLWQIALANWAVARLVWSPHPALEPTLDRVPAGQRTEFGQTVYANSITLTPGTVTLDVRDGSILVHALTRSARDDLRGGEMNRRVCRVEGTA